MRNRNAAIGRGLVIILGAMLTVACGNAGLIHQRTSSSGSVVTLGTDTPICDVESFTVTITSATLTAQGGGTPVTLVSSSAPITVDFAGLAGFTNFLNTASVPGGTYSQLQLTLSNPQLVLLNTSASPPAPVAVPVTLTSAMVTGTISPALVITTSRTSGLLLNFNLLQSLEVNPSGKLTGSVDPQFSMSALTPSGTTVGEATSLYGIVQASNVPVPSGFTGVFTLSLADGTGQNLTVFAASNTTYDGDGVTGFSSLPGNVFAEVDAIVNTSGQVVAQNVDGEEVVTVANNNSVFLGRVINLTQDSSGNATAFTLLVDGVAASLPSLVPTGSTLAVTLSSSTNYFTNWQYLNKQGITLGPLTLGLGQKVAVYGTLGSGSTPTLAATKVFLRPLTVLGNFATLKAAGSDGVTGGFTLTPCNDLFAGNPMTILTSQTTVFAGVSGLRSLTPTPMLDTTGVMFYQQKDGGSLSGVEWTGPTWVLQARGVEQPAN